MNATATGRGIARRIGPTAALLAAALAAASAGAYPLYGSEDRGIGRVEAARLAHAGEIPGRE